MKTVAELHQALRERFGEPVADLTVPAAGDLFVLAAADALHDVCRFLRDEPTLRFDFLRLITGVDWTDRISSVYHLYSFEHGHSLTLRVDLDRAAPRVSSVADLWPAADWLEREAYDMLGIEYQGHPDLKRILLPLDWEGHPLRKDYKQPEEYHGIKNV